MLLLLRRCQPRVLLMQRASSLLCSHRFFTTTATPPPTATTAAAASSPVTPPTTSAASDTAQQKPQEQPKAEQEMPPESPWKRKRYSSARPLPSFMKKPPQRQFWWFGPVPVLAAIAGGIVLYAISGSLSSFITRMNAGFSEQKLMKELEEAGVDPMSTFILYLHAAMVHRVLETPDLVEHLGGAGALRFQPESLKFVPMTGPSNQVFVMFNIYGLKHAAVINVVFDRSINEEGLPVYIPVDFTVDCWDGRLWNIDVSGMVINSSEAVRLVRQQSSKPTLALT